MNPAPRESGFIATQDVDEDFPSISPDSRYVLYTLSDGKANPMVLLDTLSRSEKILGTSVIETEIKNMKFSMEGVWRSDSKEFAYVSFLKDPEILVFDLKNSKGKELGLRGSAEFMPSISSDGKIAFISNRGSQIDVFVWDGKIRRVSNTREFEYYPKWIDENRLVYLKYDRGETYLVVDGKEYLFKGGQIDSEYPSPSGEKLLLVVNVNKLRSDLYMFSDGTFIKLDEDVLEKSVFWLSDEVYGYVKKASREEIILADLSGNKRVIRPVPGYSIESVSSSLNGWLAISVFNPKNTSTDIYLYVVVKE